MIVVEERVYEVLKHLPDIQNMNPVYAWGDEIHLNKWLAAKNKAGENTYPLIYQTSKEETQNILNDTVTTDWRVILAVNNKNVDLFNTERWALAFRNVLNPLADHIVRGFQSADFLIEAGEVKLERYGNYGDGNEHWTIDAWDALTLECTLTIHGQKICEDRLKFT